MLICASAFLIAPRHRIALFAFLFTIPLHLIFKGFDIGWFQFEGLYPEMNYFVRAMCVILIAFSIVLIGSLSNPAARWKVSVGGPIGIVLVYALIESAFPEMNASIQAMWVILGSFSVLVTLNHENWTKWKVLIVYDSKIIANIGIGLAASLVLLHFIFH